MSYIQLVRRRGYGLKTAVANTIITRLVEPYGSIDSTGPRGLITTINSIQYTAGATAHTITILRPRGLTTVSALAATSQAVINITADPGIFSHFGTISTADDGIATNDWVVYQCADGTYVADTVSSVSTLAITMTTNVPTATVLKGAPFWYFGLAADTDPATALAFEAYNAFANGLTKIGTDASDAMCGIIGSNLQPDALRALSSTTYGRWPLNGYYEPILVQSNNATNAGTIEKVVASYGRIS